MSKRTAFGFASVVKIIGIVIALIGALLSYYTYMNLDASGMAAGYYFAAGVILAVTGVLLLITKTR
ncbi:MAG: hypothetical protein NWF14_07370 [Candidatus Bathyarchaeota archaeon]|nr:hypothetical protein [Candidatus Bathyarchaeota archaeon]